MPARAQRIANRVASVFVEENSKVADRPRREHGGRARAAGRRRRRRRLTDLENKLRAKKQNYIGRLPEQIGANVQMVNGARSQFESLSMQIRSEQDHLSMVESQLDAMRQGAGVEGMTTSSHRGRRRRRRSTSTICEAQLAADRALGYTDKHPDVIRLQEEIKQARADLAAAKVSQPANRDETLKADPIYRAEGAGARPGASCTFASCRPRRRQRAAPDRRLPEPRRVGAGRRAGADLARARVRPREDAQRRSQHALPATRAWPRTWRASRAASASASSTRPTYPTAPIEPQPLKIMAIAHRRRPRARRRRRARPRVPRPLGPRHARAAERVRSAGARRDSADPRIGGEETRT